ncbi:MAG: hypothetical protein H7331_10175 [Bacteroidia bacterium]|nr:hypothetical protein [Bacteroidia bacterium]
MDTAINKNNYTKQRSIGWLVTLLFHALVAWLLYMFTLTIPDPPMDGGEGMVVNLGYVDESTGDIQPNSDVHSQPIITQQQMQVAEEVNEKIVTQSIEESVSLKTSEKATKALKEPKITTTPTEPEPKPIVEVKPVVNAASLYTGKKSNGSTSQGTSTTGTGDQGKPDGDPNSTNYKGNGGTGNTPGDGGDGNKGTGSGKGPSYNMDGRKAKTLPTPSFNVQESGKVIVEIFIDQQGNVIRANTGFRGSTTTNSTLLAKAKEAALRAKFSANDDAPEEQRGTIVYNFLLK